jgi:predicted N-acetyltransferase YhbS
MPKVRIRAARAADKADVEAICARVWEEAEDYVPEVWDDWLADPYGKPIVAQLEDRVIGLAKLTRLSADQWWLEGLRVDRKHQHQGVGGSLQAHLVEEFNRTGQEGTLRFGTHSRNHPVHRLASRDGFRHVATYRLYEAEPLPSGQALPLRQLAEGDLDPAWRLIQGSPRYRAAGGLYETFWSWENLTRERLAHHFSRGEGWGIDLDDCLASVALICQTDKEDAVDIGYVDGREDAMETLLLALRGLTTQRGCDKVRFRAVDEPKLITVVERAGYQPSWDRDLWIFELSADCV